MYLTQIIKGLFKSNYRNVYIFAVAYPVATVILSLWFGSGEKIDVVSLSWVWGIMLFVPICIEEKIDYLKIFLQGTFFVAVVVNFIFILDVLNILNIFDNPLAIFLTETGDMLLGKGALSTYGYFVFYKTVPLLVVSLCYYSFRGDIFKQLVLLLALCASGTRANFLTGVIAIVFGNLYKYRNNKSVVLMFVFFVAFILYFYVYDDYVYKSSLKSYVSDSVKISDILTITEMMARDKISALLGWGIGSYFLSETRGWINCVEVSFFDYARQVGLMFFSLFMYFILYPIYKLYLKKEEWWLLVGYILYISIASTNPLLLTSTAFLVYLLVYIEFNKETNGSKIK